MDHTGKLPFPETGILPQHIESNIPGILLWQASLQQPAAVINTLRTWLPPEELQRTERMATPRLRQRAIAIRAQLRWLLANALRSSTDSTDAAPHQPAASTTSLLKALRFDTGPHGRPHLAPPHRHGHVLDFNLSHSEDRLLLGILQRPTPQAPHPWTCIGVDLEALSRQRSSTRLAERVLTPAEQQTLQGLDESALWTRFLHYWTLKEAFSKADGQGFSIGFNRLDFELTQPTSQPPTIRALPHPYVLAAWHLAFVDAGNDCVAALALGHR